MGSVAGRDGLHGHRGEVDHVTLLSTKRLDGCRDVLDELAAGLGSLPKQRTSVGARWWRALPCSVSGCIMALRYAILCLDANVSLGTGRSLK